MELIGQQFAQYEIIAKLGQGGMGEVYKARDNRLGRVVAIKILPPQAAKDETVKRRFLIEARAASALNHPYILTVYEIGETPEFEYMVMEFVNGITLREHLAKSHLKLSEALDIFLKIAEGLDKAHQAKIIHRDLKPENIMLTKDGFIKILDFGLAKLEYEFAEKPATDELKSDPNIIQGTVGYLAPEMIQCQPADIRSDIFAFGVMFYEALSGHLPFDGRNLGAKLVATLQYNPPDISEFRADLPQEIVNLTNKTIAKNPDDRYQNLSPIVEILRAIKLEIEVETSISSIRNPPEFLEKIRKNNSGDIVIKLADSDRTIANSINKITSSTDVSTTKKIDIKQATANTFYLTSLTKTKLFRLVVVSLVAMLATTLVFTFWQNSKTIPINNLPISNNKNLEKFSLAVIYFENISQDEELKWLERGLAEMLTTNLAQIEAFDIVSSQQIYELVARVNNNEPKNLNREKVLEIAQQTHVPAFVTGTILKIGKRIRLTINLQDTASGKIIFSDKIDGENINDIFSIVDELTVKLTNHFGIKNTNKPDISISEVTTSSITAYKHYEQGVEKSLQLYLSDAVVEFEKAVAIDPNFAMAYLQLGLAKLRLEDEKGTRAAISKAVELIDRVASKEKLYIRGLEALIEGQSEKRIEIFKEITERFPKDKEAFRQLGTAYLSDEQLDAAIIAFQQTVKLDPDYLEGHNRLAYAYAAKGNFSQAIEHASKYVLARPNEPNPHDTMGDIYLLAGQADKALLEYKKALEIKPDFINYYPYWKIAAAYRVLNDLDQAEAYYRKQLALKDKNLGGADSIKSLAMIALLRGNKEDTIKYFTSAIEDELDRGTRPMAVLTYVELALFYLEMGDLTKAKQALNNSQKLMEDASSQLDLFSRYNDRNVELNYIKLLIALGELEKVEIEIEKFLQLNKKSYTQFSAAMLKLYAKASLAEARKNYSLALDLWLELRKQSGIEHNYQLAIGRCLFMLERYSEAQVEFTKLANAPMVMHQQSASPIGTEVILDNLKANYYLGKIAEIQSNLPQAKKHFQYIVSRWQSEKIPISEVAYSEKFLKNN